MITKTCYHINLDYLDMMTDGDGEMRDTMLTMLMDELPAEVSKMRPLLTDASWNESSGKSATNSNPRSLSSATT